MSYCVFIILALGGSWAQDTCVPIGAGCCHGTTGYPASSKLVDGPGFTPASCAAACTGGCKYYTFKLGWCTAWSASMTSCEPLATDRGDCGSDYSSATTYRCGAAPCVPIGAGCCHGTTGYPASSKLVDGRGFTPASCAAACTGGCKYYTFKLGWCTAWSASMTSCEPLATDPGNCGSDYSSATTYRCGCDSDVGEALGGQVVKEPQKDVLREAVKQLATDAAATCAPVGAGCCHGTTGYPASSKIVDGPGFTPASCAAACTGGCKYYTFKLGWCTAWHASMTSCEPLATDPGNCGSDYSSATTYRCGAAPALPTCSHGRFSWGSCSSHRTCVSANWDGCAANVCQQKISAGSAVSMCQTTAGGDGCNYGSDSNTCAYDAAGNCCYSDLTDDLVI